MRHLTNPLVVGIFLLLTILCGLLLNVTQIKAGTTQIVSSLGPNFFSDQNFPFVVKKWGEDGISKLVWSVLGFLNFNPNKSVVRLGDYDIDNKVPLGVFSLLLVVAATLFYWKAVSSKALYDDFIALALVYMVLSALRTLAKAYRLEMVDDEWLYILTFVVIVVLATLVSQPKLVDDLGQFLRSLAVPSVLVFFLWPDQFSKGIAGVFAALEGYGKTLLPIPNSGNFIATAIALFFLFVFGFGRQIHVFSTAPTVKEVETEKGNDKTEKILKEILDGGGGRGKEKERH